MKIIRLTNTENIPIDSEKKLLLAEGLQGNVQHFLFYIKEELMKNRYCACDEWREKRGRQPMSEDDEMEV